MGRVNKVFISSQALFTDGSCLTLSGSSSIASIAEWFSVPVFVLTPKVHFTPLITFNQKSSFPLQSPMKVFHEGMGKPNLEVISAVYDVIPSEQVTLIVTEDDVYSPDYIYRVFAEYYPGHDYEYKFD